MADRRATMTLDSAKRREPTASVDVHTISMAMGMEATWDTSNTSSDTATAASAHAQRQHRARTDREWAELHSSRQAAVQRPLPIPLVDKQKKKPAHTRPHIRIPPVCNIACTHVSTHQDDDAVGDGGNELGGKLLRGERGDGGRVRGRH